MTQSDPTVAETAVHGPGTGKASPALRVEKVPPTITAKHRMLGILLAIGGVLVLSPDATLVRLGSLPVAEHVFWRGVGSALGWVMVFPFIFAAGLGRTRFDVRAHTVLSALLALGAIGFLWSVKVTYVANALLVLSSLPLVTALFSFIFLGETPTQRAIWACVGAVVGIAVMALGGGEWRTSLNDLWAIIPVIILGVVFVLQQTGFRLNVHYLGIFTAGFLLIYSVILLPFSSITLPPLDILWPTVTAGIISTLSFWLIFGGARYLQPTEIGLAMLVEPLLGPVIAWYVLDEVPLPATFVGGTILLGSLVTYFAFSYRHELALQGRPNG